jgi:uncharacterized protein (TIGR02266 family)
MAGTDDAATERTAGPRTSSPDDCTAVPVARGGDIGHIEVSPTWHQIVRCYGAKGFAWGVVETLNAEGLSARTKDPLPVGSHVDFDLELPDGTVPMKGVVEWSRRKQSSAGPAGMGVSFVDLDPKVRARIAALVDNPPEG